MRLGFYLIVVMVGLLATPLVMRVFSDAAGTAFFAVLLFGAMLSYCLGARG